MPERIFNSKIYPMLVVAVLGLAGIASLLYRGSDRGRWWLLSAVLLPQLVLVPLNMLDLYPAADRMRLFLLPCVVVVATIFFESLVATVNELARDPSRVRRPTRFMAPTAAMIILVAGCAAQFRPQPSIDDEEDTRDAMAWLKTEFHEGDALYVHASVREEYKLYAGLLGFSPSAIQWGNTGRPCCQRQAEDWKMRGSEALLEQDIARLNPVSLPSQLWTLNTSRVEHWDFIGLDEEKALQALLVRRGCRLQLNHRWQTISASEFRCGAEQ
jgi:hypothetical protein